MTRDPREPRGHETTQQAFFRAEGARIGEGSGLICLAGDSDEIIELSEGSSENTAIVPLPKDPYSPQGRCDKTIARQEAQLIRAAIGAGQIPKPNRAYALLAATLGLEREITPDSVAGYALPDKILSRYQGRRGGLTH